MVKVPTKKYERHYWKKGYKLVAGVDEAGRGAWAGPLVAAAVILPQGFYLPDVRDSKKILPSKREELFEKILKAAISYSISFVEPSEIDKKGLKYAHLLALKKAVVGLEPRADFILCDYYELPFENSKAVLYGDTVCFSIACASILAKVYRDRLMCDLDRRYPQYGFARHKGYGTKEHWKALREFGPSPVHRLSFKGVGYWEEKLEGFDEIRAEGRNSRV